MNSVKLIEFKLRLGSNVKIKIVSPVWSLFSPYEAEFARQKKSSWH